jgi:hypothetical protein
MTTDHMDPSFIEERKMKLNTFLRDLVMIPHVADMSCMKAFLGLIDQIREVSYTFHLPKLGLTLAANVKNVTVSPTVVQSIQTPENCEGICIGDCVSRINGVSVNGTNFAGCVNRIKMLPRPLIIHFIQIIGTAADSVSSSVVESPTTTGTQSHAFPHLNMASPVVATNSKPALASKPLPTFTGEYVPCR